MMYSFKRKSVFAHFDSLLSQQQFTGCHTQHKYLNSLPIFHYGLIYFYQLQSYKLANQALNFRLPIRKYIIKSSKRCMVRFNFLWMFVLMKQFQHVWDYVLSNERLLSRCKLYYCMHIDVHTYSYDNILWNVYLPSSLSLTTQNSKLMCYKWRKREFFSMRKWKD